MQPNHRILPAVAVAAIVLSGTATGRDAGSAGPCSHCVEVRTDSVTLRTAFRSGRTLRMEIAIAGAPAVTSVVYRAPERAARAEPSGREPERRREASATGGGTGRRIVRAARVLRLIASAVGRLVGLLTL